MKSALTPGAPDAVGALISVPVLLLDKQCRIAGANTAAEEWLGSSTQSLQKHGFAITGSRGMSLSAFVEGLSPDGGDRIAQAEKAGGADRASFHARWSDDQAVCVITIIPLQAPDPGQASASAALGFGRMLAHELKNPIASLRGAAQLIGLEEVSAEVHDLSKLIIEDADRITHLADRWSGVGDLTLGTCEQINLNHIAHQALDSLRRANQVGSIKVFEHFDPSLPETHGDPLLLLQAVLNFLQNAVDALEGSGQIVIETRFDNGSRSRVDTGLAPLVISVQDDGPGIPDTLLADIYTPFVTTKPAGEGLGLAFTSRVAALHNGRIDCDNMPGATRFNLRLPVAAEEML